MALQNTLTGLKVVDLTRNLAGPYCTVALGDLGADVVKVEEPSRGDDTRAWAPTDGDLSAIFASANRNKRSIGIDLDDPDGASLVRELIRRSAVLVESFRPGALDRRGLGWRDAHQLNERLVYCSISAFGRTGPRAAEPGYDPVVQAATGIMSITGEPGGPPVRLGIGAVDLGAGMWALVGILAALAAREHTGQGTRVETSLFETAAWWLSYHVAMNDATGVSPGRHGSASPAISPYEAFATADGDLFVAAANDRLFALLCDALELEELPDDPRFGTNGARVRHGEELHRLLGERLLEKRADEWERILKAQSIPCSRVRSVAEFVDDPHAHALGLLPLVAGRRVVALPLGFDGERPPPRTPPPRLGEHTDEILNEIGYDEVLVAELRARGTIA